MYQPISTTSATAVAADSRIATRGVPPVSHDGRREQRPQQHRQYGTVLRDFSSHFPPQVGALVALFPGIGAEQRAQLGLAVQRTFVGEPRGDHGMIVFAPADAGKGRRRFRSVVCPAVVVETAAQLVVLAVAGPGRVVFVRLAIIANGRGNEHSSHQQGRSAGNECAPRRVPKQQQTGRRRDQQRHRKTLESHAGADHQKRRRRDERRGHRGAALPRAALPGEQQQEQARQGGQETGRRELQTVQKRQLDQRVIHRVQPEPLSQVALLLAVAFGPIRSGSSARLGHPSGDEHAIQHGDLGGEVDRQQVATVPGYVRCPGIEAAQHVPDGNVGKDEVFVRRRADARARGDHRHKHIVVGLVAGSQRQHRDALEHKHHDHRGAQRRFCCAPERGRQRGVGTVSK